MVTPGFDSQHEQSPRSRNPTSKTFPVTSPHVASRHVTLYISLGPIFLLAAHVPNSSSATMNDSQYVLLVEYFSGFSYSGLAIRPLCAKTSRRKRLPPYLVFFVTIVRCWVASSAISFCTIEFASLVTVPCASHRHELRMPYVGSKAA